MVRMSENLICSCRRFMRKYCLISMPGIRWIKERSSNDSFQKRICDFLAKYFCSCYRTLLLTTKYCYLVLLSCEDDHLVWNSLVCFPAKLHTVLLLPLPVFHSELRKAEVAVH